jgi:hypothetical protein
LGSPLPSIAVNANPHREHVVLEPLQRQALTAFRPMAPDDGMITPACGSL